MRSGTIPEKVMQIVINLETNYINTSEQIYQCMHQNATIYVFCVYMHIQICINRSILYILFYQLQSFGVVWGNWMNPIELYLF